MRLVLVLALAFVPAVAHAQTEVDPFEQADHLRHEVSGHPDDTRLLCDFGWAMLRIHDDEAMAALSGGPAAQARTVLDHAITLLGTPTDPALQQRLGACLYSRARLEEHASLAASIPFYERSIAARPNAVAAARLASVRRAVADGWVEIEHHPTSDAGEVPAEAALVTSEDARVLARWQSRAGDEVLAAFDDDHFYVVARLAGAAWRALSAVEVTTETEPRDVWLEPPSSAGERLRIVPVVVRQTRVVMDDGPEWNATAIATTVALATDGSLSVVLQDRWAGFL